MANEAIKPTVPAAPVEGQQQEQAPQNDPRLDQLAKRERAFRNQQRQFQQEQQAFKSEQEKLKSAPPDTSWKDRLKKDFINVAAEAGLSHDEIANQLMNRTPESMDIKAMKSYISSLEAKINDGLKQVTDTQSKAYDQALKQVARDVKIETQGNEAYELINSKGTVGQDAVLEYIKSTYEEDGILLTANEAAQEVEDFLLEEATALAKLKKVQAKLAPPAAKEEAGQKTQSQKTQTLTNQATTSTPSGKSDAKQRRERAILAMQGLLNK